MKNFFECACICYLQTFETRATAQCLEEQKVKGDVRTYASANINVFNENGKMNTAEKSKENEIYVREAVIQSTSKSKKVTLTSLQGGRDFNEYITDFQTFQNENFLQCYNVSLKELSLITCLSEAKRRLTKSI